MLTKTEGGEAWRNARVAINSVDPAYMSAEPKWMQMVGIVALLAGRMVLLGCCG
jgi:hypothetical protein